MLAKRDNGLHTNIYRQTKRHPLVDILVDVHVNLSKSEQGSIGQRAQAQLQCGPRRVRRERPSWSLWSWSSSSVSCLLFRFRESRGFGWEAVYDLRAFVQEGFE